MPSKSTPSTVPPSPFFQPFTPDLVVVTQTPGGSRRELPQKRVEEHKSGLLGCTANLVNAIVGSGIVGIPFAIREAGLLAGIILVFLMAVITEKSLRLLISTAKHMHCPTYETAAEAAFGLPGFRFVSFNMFIMAYGAMLSYQMIVKDCFSTILGVGDDPLWRRLILFVISLVIMLPVSCQRDVADLAKTSRLNVVIDSLLVLLVAWNAPFWMKIQDVGAFSALLEDTLHFDTIFVGVGVLSFAYVCQHSAFIIAGSLKNPTTQRWSTCTRSALLLCAVLATTCGMTGYLGYQEHTKGNILNNLDRTSLTANTARAMLGTTMLFVYPLETFVARHVCVVLLFKGRTAHEGDDTTILNRTDRRIILTVVLYVSALIPALIFDDLGPVLAISGAVGGSCLSYIGPGAVFLGIHGKSFLDKIDSSWFGSLRMSQTKTTKQLESADARRAGETTPLVATKANVAELSAVEDEGKQLIEDVERSNVAVQALKHIAWYAMAMPLWCCIAETGRGGVTTHIHEMTLRSPHPIRIGDVEYRRAAVVNGRVEANADSLMIPPTMNFPQNNSMPQLGDVQRQQSFHGRSPVDGSSINHQIAKNILARGQQQTKPRLKPIEVDPQGKEPTWWDFAVAIFFVLFGLLSFSAGIISLLASGGGSSV